MTATAEKKKRTPRGGTAAIFQRASDGLFVTWVELSKDPMTGKRRRKQFTAKTRKAVTDKVREWHKHNETGRGQTREYTVAEWMTFWLENYAARTLTPSGYRGYKSKTKHVIAALGSRKMMDVEAEDILLFHDYLTGYKGLSLGYATDVHYLLQAAFTDAVGAGRAKMNPCKSVRTPGRNHPDLEILQVPEAKRILANEVLNERNGSKWAFALLTGARRGEVLGLTWDRVDFENNVIDLTWQLQRHNWEHGCGDHPCGRKQAAQCLERKITHKADWSGVHLVDAFWLADPKTNAGDRIIPLVDPLRAILLRHRELTKNDPNPFNLVWTSDEKMDNTRTARALDGKPVDPDKHTKEWRTVQSRNGIDEANQIRGHDLRHTAVTLLFDLNVPEGLIPQIVGHSVVAMSKKYRNRARKRAAMSAPMIEAMRTLGRELNFLDGPEVQRMLETTETDLRILWPASKTPEDRSAIETVDGELDQAA